MQPSPSPRVVHLSSTDAGTGAGRGAAIVHRALLARGIDSWMVVGERKSDAPNVVGPAGRWGWFRHTLRRRIDRLPVARYQTTGYFSPSWLPGRTLSRALALKPDILHLHWINDGLLRIEDLSLLPVPAVWTMRDMWPFTGGCHYAGECRRFESGCGHCPVLGSDRSDDLSARVRNRKAVAWADLDVHPVALSRWLADDARSSALPLFENAAVISNAVDVETWQPGDQTASRDRLGLAGDRQHILFIAIKPMIDRRKGFPEFVEACRILSAAGDRDRYSVVVVGADAPDVPIGLGLPTTFLGRIDRDEDLRQVYRAVDVTVVPSLQEAFGKTVAESMACGTPVVVFDNSGPRDIVEHQKTGYVAASGDVPDLAQGIAWVLADARRRTQLGTTARSVIVERFSQAGQAQRYIELYHEILAR